MRLKAKRFIKKLMNHHSPSMIPRDQKFKVSRSHIDEQHEQALRLSFAFMQRHFHVKCTIKHVIFTWRKENVISSTLGMVERVKKPSQAMNVVNFHAFCLRGKIKFRMQTRCSGGRRWISRIRNRRVIAVMNYRNVRYQSAMIENAKCCDDFFSIFHAVRRMTRSLLLSSADSFSSLSVSNSESALIQLWRFLILHYRIVKCDNSRTEQNTILARGEKRAAKESTNM